MSYAIENLKFTIFGHGYDATRNDSGDGAIEPTIHDMTAEYCAIDEAGKYAWIVGGGGRLYKLNIATWEQQAHSIPFVGPLYHPCNVANNYGVIFESNTRVVVFDLTTGEIIKDFAPSGTFAQPLQCCDCILVDDVIYLVQLNHTQNSATLRKVFLNEEDATSSVIASGVECCGFANDGLIYGYWAKQWFSQVSSAYAWTLNGNTEWSVTEPSTSESFNVRLFTLCGNGYLYAISFKEGKWVMGEYGISTAPEFVTPLPLRTFGEFPTVTDIQANVVYSQGKTKAVFQTNKGTYYTDFQKVRTLDENISDLVPLAMNDKLVISSFNAYRKVAVHYL